jgi:hypothetical protein
MVNKQLTPSINLAARTSAAPFFNDFGVLACIGACAGLAPQL